MSKKEQTPIEAERLSELGKLPRGWGGATKEQLLNSARRIIEQAAISGEGDPRLPAAKRVIKLLGK